MGRGRQKFIFIFLAILILAILANIFLLKFSPAKSPTGFSQANIQFIISKAQVPLEEPGAAIGGACAYDWICADWQPSKCSETEMQTRKCINQGTCGGIVGKPEETRTCIFEPEKPETEKSLMDIKITLPELSREIFPGEPIFVQIEIINFGGTKRIDVLLEYKITDPENKIIYSQVETAAVETKLNLIKEINLPIDLNAGTYILQINAIYDGQSASAITEFQVIKASQKEKIFIVIILVLIIVLAILIYIIMRQREKYALIKKADLKKLITKK